MVIHLLGEKEKKFAYKGLVELEDLETGKIQQVYAEQIANTYQQQFNTFQQTLKNQLATYHIAYQETMLQQPLQITLKAFLHFNQRK